MFKVTKDEVNALRENRMGRFVTVINKTHGSRAKTYYVVEDQRIRNFLGEYRDGHTVKGGTNEKKGNKNHT